MPPYEHPLSGPAIVLKTIQDNWSATPAARVAAEGTVKRVARRLLCVLAVLAAASASAQAQPATDRARPRDSAPAAAPSAPDAVTKQSLDLPGRTLRFTATAGFIRVLDDKAAPEAEIAATAYTLDGADPATRPVTFVLNGGPGMASAWLQMGAVGPWRIPLIPAPSAPAAPQPNADTWLDFTDLVFLDPVGTGYSRFIDTSEDARKRLWSVDGDIAVLSQAIRRWLDKSGRNTAPKYLLGESYGGFRGPRLARRLAENDGVGLRGLVLLSPVLDFGNHSGALDVLGYAVTLPSMAATQRAEPGKPVTRMDLHDAEAYASGDFLTDVLHGVADPAATARVVDRMATLTGLDPALVRRQRGLVSSWTFIHEHDRGAGQIASQYDGTVRLPDPFPEAPGERNADPLLDGLRAPLTESVLAVYQMLHWHPEGVPYRLVNMEAGRQWDYGRGYNRPQSFEALRQALALDPGLHVLVAHGLFDLVTPYFATQLLLNQIPPTSGGDRVRLATYEGGHMFYTVDQSRQAFRADAKTLIAGPPP